MQKHEGTAPGAWGRGEGRHVCRPLEMTTRIGAIILVAVGVFAAVGARANNLALTNLVLKPLDDTRAFAQFDIRWENSWRHTNVNHDAAWVFFKIKPEGRSAWEHVTLETNGHVAGTGTAVEIIVPSDRVGCLVRRAGEGTGTLSVANVKLAWNFASNSLVRTDRVRLQAFALELVYVAEGSFWVGDGTAANIYGNFEAGTNGTPFQVTNEAYEITLGGGGAGSLGNNNGSGMAVADDFNDATSKMLPTNFPKGYAAFYCMKYEITQGQYRDFLNTLTRVQQINRTTSLAANYFAMSGVTYIADRNGIRCPSSVPIAPATITFGCDGNANKIMNETNDAMDRACNYLSGTGDIYAFADWAGLRPMTELEYEKACRGPLAPVADEYAWGSTIITATAGVLLNSGTGMERVTNGNCRTSFGWDGPFRVGIYAVAGSMRQTAGASYWGIMELSGNVCEQAVTVGNTTGRAFTGLHGDGALTAAGDASVTGWPSSGSSGGGVRGGLWNNGYGLSVRLSDRTEMSRSGGIASSMRTGVTGGRVVRTAP